MILADRLRMARLGGGGGFGLIGVQGEAGFGVGVCDPALLPADISERPGTRDITTALTTGEYGNYVTSNGSHMGFVPRFYYRIGSAQSPRYGTYGANAHDVVGVDTFATEAEANAAGYAMPRAFIDGGQTLHGFFYFTYLASKDGTTTCKSIPDAHPISLTTNTSYNPSNGMSGCTGNLADAVVLARAMGAGYYCATVFQASALAILATAHGQAATVETCAWYDASGVTNFPKGCNNGSLSDVNDSSVTYAASFSAKPRTRAITNFAKTTHNGQACGIADVNGSMWQASIGVTSPGSSPTDTAQVANGGAYVLKPSTPLASLTAGFGGSTDIWGTASSLATNYDAVSNFFPWGATVGWTYFGNGANQVFSGAASGTDWLRTNCGVQAVTSGTSGSGTNQFGNDGCYQYNRANLFPLVAGYWVNAADAGVFCRTLNSYRSYVTYTVGFRAACSAFGQ